MSLKHDRETPQPPFRTRLVRVILSIVIFVPVTVIIGYGGWMVLSLWRSGPGRFGGTESVDQLRQRLLRWPDRNRAVLRSNGRVEVPIRP